MVSGHVIGHEAGSGLQVADGSAFRHFYFSFEFLRMPLFTVISGFVYAMRPITRPTFFQFLRGKTRRLIIPLITVGSAQFLLKAIIPDINNPVYIKEIWKIYILPFEHFWFLQALVLVFFTITIMELFRLMNSFKGWIICFTGAFLIYFFVSDFNLRFFSFGNYLYLLPHFILGIGLLRFKDLIYAQMTFFLISFLTGTLIIQLFWFDIITTQNEVSKLLILGAGFAGNILLFRFRIPIRWLSLIGSYAFGIYLFHVFGTAGCRIILQNMGVESDIIIFFCSLLAGLFVPVLLEKLINKYTTLQVFFFGHEFFFLRKKPIPVTHLR
jgi:glucans biosynthesis protein C